MSNEKIHKIMDLCLEAKGHGHDCFINYYGHVNLLKIKVNLYGWSNGAEPSYSCEINLTYPNINKRLDEIIEYLEDVINSDDRNFKLNEFRRKFDSIMTLSDVNMRDYDLSQLLTKIEFEFSIPAFKDEAYNTENPDVMELYQSVSNERSFIKALKV